MQLRVAQQPRRGADPKEKEGPLRRAEGGIVQVPCLGPQATAVAVEDRDLLADRAEVEVEQEDRAAPPGPRGSGAFRWSAVARMVPATQAIFRPR